MSFATYDIKNLVYGERWSLIVTLRNRDKTPIDITSSTFYGEFRSGTTRAATLVQAISTENGTITKTDAVNGVLEITISSANALKFTRMGGIWDLWRIVGGERDKLLFGSWESRDSATDWGQL